MKAFRLLAAILIVLASAMAGMLSAAFVTGFVFFAINGQALIASSQGLAAIGAIGGTLGVVAGCLVAKRLMLI